MAADTRSKRTSPLLETILNLSKFHREHEKFYASSPRELAVKLQRHARTLLALADRWSTVEPSDGAAANPYMAAADLNDPAAVQLDGVLFLEGGERPAELTHLVRDLRAAADDFAQTGEWLATAMHSSWDMAAALPDVDGLADLLGERHRIIANDWQAAGIISLVARLLRRAADIVELVDFTPAALRRDLAGSRRAPALLYSSAELIARAADLCSESAGLVHDNERRWRIFRQRIAALASPTGPTGH